MNPPPSSMTATVCPAPVVRPGSCRCPPPGSAGTRCPGRPLAPIVPPGAEVRLGLRPGVQPEHRGHHPVQRGRQEQRALAVAVGDPPPAPWVRAADLPQRRAERAGQVAQGTRHLDPAGDRVDGGDLQAAAAQLPGDQVHVGGVGAVPLGQLIAAQHGGPDDDLLRKLGPPPQHQGDLGPLLGVQRRGVRDVGQRPALAAGQPHRRSRFIRHGKAPLSRYQGSSIDPRGEFFLPRR